MVLKLEFQNNLEQNFREIAMKKYGYMRGSLRKASEEAVKEWIMKNSTKVPIAENPFKLVYGILANLKGKKSSIDLQHEVGRLWAK